MSNKKIWFVTGASRGLGLSLVKKLLAEGYSVAATSRNTEELAKAVGVTDNFLPIAMDIKNEASVAAALQGTVAHFGRLDVVVNNAGYGLAGAIEELSDEEARENFNVNVFGSLNVIRKAMPYLRAQRSGHVFNISSVGGLLGDFPGWAIYCATKFAVNGFSEALAAETKEFGVKVTVVEPGYFRTDFLTAGSMGTPKNEISDYTAVRAAQTAHQQSINGNQPNDPEKAAIALIQVAEQEEAPKHLVLGADALEMVNAKMHGLLGEFKKWEAISLSTAL